MSSRTQLSKAFHNMAEGREPLPNPPAFTSKPSLSRNQTGATDTTTSDGPDMTGKVMAEPQEAGVNGAGEKAPAVERAKKRRRFPRVKLPAMKKISLAQLWRYVLEWLSNPLNFAAFVWCLLATAAFIVLVWVELGFAAAVIKNDEVTESVKEDATQILNALFVLMCLVWHPVFFRDVLLLVRWSGQDKWEIRSEYCKGGKRKPRDRTHMAIVVFWLHVTCFATYAFAIMFWVFPAGQRPTGAIIFLTVLSFVAPGVAFLWILFSPLGKDYDIVREGETTSGRVKLFEKSQSFFLSRKQVRDAQWEGSVCPGCCADRKVACLTFWCPFCMFGYNMERLGFGNRYMHMIMFIIVLVGPLLIFWLVSALVPGFLSKVVVWYTGVAVAVLGLTYGGAWRIRMRTTYKLPAARWMCGSAELTDLSLWVPCACCALCQEVRTADQYEVGMAQKSTDLEDGAGELYVVEEEDADEHQAEEDDEGHSNEEDVENGAEDKEGEPTDAPAPTKMEK